MDDTADNQNISIQSLPNEIITLILQNNTIQDIVAFGTTCKRFWEIIESDEILWKCKLKSTLTSVMFESVDKHCHGQWRNTMKKLCKVKNTIYSEILAMSPKFYLKCSEVTIRDVQPFFNLALEDNMNYYFVLFILQGMVREGEKLIDKNYSIKPFTMTELYYAKSVLCYLVQTFLAVKWVQSHLKNELTPEIVVNFFLQWVDPSKPHLDTDIEESINVLVNNVKMLLNTQHPELASEPKQECTHKLLSEKQVLNAVTQVVYPRRTMVIVPAANLDTLDIIKVLKSKFSNIIVAGAIYQAVARRCGVHCEMIAFPNHLFLEWVDRSDAARPVAYTVDLNTGELKPRRRCPFSQAPSSNYKYCPDSLLQYIYSSYHMTMGAIHNWNTQNAQLLIDFLGTSQSSENPYRNYLSYLIDHTHLSAMNLSLDLTYLNVAHIQIIRALVALNEPAKPSRPKKFLVKHRISDVRYAVGMICYHKKFNYVGIVRGWDLSCDGKWVDRVEMELTLEFGTDQPFYYLLAADQSPRYVAQENLIEITQPSRLYHLEDAISYEFMYFDGFSYVPNDEKKTEYPEDGPIAALYHNRSHYRRTHTVIAHSSSY